MTKKKGIVIALLVFSAFFTTLTFVRQMEKVHEVLESMQ